MSNWFDTLEGMYIQTWDTLVQGMVDHAHPAHCPTFATMSPSHWPEARSVVLRGVDTEAATLTIHTDLQSDKIGSLHANSKVALHIWDPSLTLQIRLQGEVTIKSGRSVRGVWDRSSDEAKENYGAKPPPGRPIEKALGYIRKPDPDAFAIVDCELMHIDLVHLGEYHRRAAYSRVRNWQGQWLSP